MIFTTESSSRYVYALTIDVMCQTWKSDLVVWYLSSFVLCVTLFAGVFAPTRRELPVVVLVRLRAV